MAAKDITQLAPADSFDEGDLLLIRKTGAGADRNINFNKFIDSISSLGVHGFNARVSEGEEDKITVTTSNGVLFSKYYDGMKIFFFAPVDTTNPQVRVGNLPYKDILKYDSEDSIALKKSRYIEAIYVGDSDSGKFFQTNEYIKLVSAEPLPIPQQQPVPASLPPIPIPMPLPPLVPLPDDIWDPNYDGNPDDPANAENPDSLDSRGNRIFDAKVLKVGNGGDFDDITDAIRDLTKRLGVNGDGKNHAILILNDYDQEKFRQNPLDAVDDNGRNHQSDISWISIFSENNKVVTFINSGTGSLLLYNRKNPILNFKMRQNKHYGSDWVKCLFYYIRPTEIIFGRNAEIEFNPPEDSKGSGLICRNNDVYGIGESWGIIVTAKYGLKIISPYKLLYNVDHYKLLLNKAVFEHTGKEGFIIDNDPQTVNYSIEMYNSEVKFKHKNDNANFGAFNLKAKLNNNNTVYMRNVKCTDRSGKMIGIITNNSTAKLENCNFAAAKATSGYDIMVDGDTGNNTITLQGTKGTTNQPKNTATAKGNILSASQNAVVNVTVGTNGQYPSINAAIEGLEAEFPDGVTDCKATIKLLSGHIIKEQIFIKNKDLSWITLISEDEEVKLDVSYITINSNCSSWNGGYKFLYITRASSININLRLVQTGNFLSDTYGSLVIIGLHYGNIKLVNSNFKEFLCESIIRGTNSNIKLINTFFKGVKKRLSDRGYTRGDTTAIHLNSYNYHSVTSHDILSTISIEGGGISGEFDEGLILTLTKGTINNLSIKDPYNALIADSCEINFNKLNINGANIDDYSYGLKLMRSTLSFTSCDITDYVYAIIAEKCKSLVFKSSSIKHKTIKPSDNKHGGLRFEDNIDIKIIDTTFNGSRAQGIIFHKCKNVALTNCTTGSQTGEAGVIVASQEGTNMIIDSGYYNCSADGATSNVPILAYGVGSTIRLINNPIGASSASSGAQIIRG